MSFHPRDPSLLAAGGFTGEVFVWSSTEEGAAAADAPAAATNMRGHRERVTALKWLPNDGALLSAALDGKILLWTWEKRSSSLELKKAFSVAAERLPRSLRVVGRARAEVGVTALSVNAEDGDIIVVGTEAGAVFQARLLKCV